MTVIVCPWNDRECGDYPARWCAACPKRKAMTPADDLPCTHDLVERECAVADGFCPICLSGSVIHLTKAFAERDAEIERLNRVIDASAAQERNWTGWRDRAETAEARVKELERQLEIAEHDSVHQSQLYSEYTEEWAKERDTLRTRVAELEERLMVMCVVQIKELGAERIAWMIERMAMYGQSHGWWVKGAVDADKSENWTQDPNAAATFPTCESAACVIAALKPSHLRGETAHRIFHERVKPMEHMWSNPLRPAPDPPAPAPESSQGVEGEPHHER